MVWAGGRTERGLLLYGGRIQRRAAKAFTGRSMGTGTGANRSRGLLLALLVSCEYDTCIVHAACLGETRIYPLGSSPILLGDWIRGSHQLIALCTNARSTLYVVPSLSLLGIGFPSCYAR